uniref:7TM_GPCR_Srx domain-containing protein n=1 Tax=Strongyloides papillosus TaxID=174720 RepID=A0A0N5C8S6_STREA
MHIHFNTKFTCYYQTVSIFLKILLYIYGELNTLQLFKIFARNSKLLPGIILIIGQFYYCLYKGKQRRRVLIEVNISSLVNRYEHIITFIIYELL